MTAIEERVFNFSAGPAALPLPVLQRAQDEMLCLPGAGASIMEISHRSAEFLEILTQAKDNLRKALGVPDDYAILFLQGGSRLQFSMIPMNLARGASQGPAYLLTGSWSKHAYNEAVKLGPAVTVWDGKESNYTRLPAPDEYEIDPASPYAYFASNETIQGVQFPPDPPATGLSGESAPPVVCDASSDFLSRALPMEKYGLIYACAQKNAGPAGVTIVIMRNDLLERSDDSLPGYLNFKQHAEANSLYNTAPTFGIYMFNLVLQWLLNDIGGMENMQKQNEKKAKMLYDVIDSSDGFYRPHADPSCRSRMNVTFRLPDEEKEKAFVSQAQQRRLYSLKGHRSVGGIRASIYNAMPVEGVETLCQFMTDFQKNA